MNREVLLIEDDDNYRISVKYLFGDEPYRFVEAASPEEGIVEIDANPQIRVILLDLSFDGCPGTAVLDHIKERSREYRVIVLTGHDELLAAEQAGEYDVFNYLPKADQSSNQAIRFSVDQAFKDLEREHLNQKIRLLLDVQRGIDENREPKETLDLICQAVRSTVGAHICHIRVYDFTRGDYHLEGFAGPEEGLRRAFEQPRAKGDLFSGRVVESGQPEVFPDLQGMDEFRNFKSVALERPNLTPEERRYFETVRSAYIVPISTGLFETAVDAVLNVGSDSLNFFDAEQRALVDEFVNQAALAITKYWLQRKREEIHWDYSQISKMLGDMSDRLSGTDVLQGIYDVVTRKISEIVNPEVVSIFLYNEVTGRIENVAELRGNNPVKTPNESYTLGQSLSGSVFKSDKTIQLPEPGDPGHLKPLQDSRFDHANREKYLSNIPSSRFEHYIGVPIRMGGKPRGVLRVMNKRSKYYDDPSADEKLYLLERGFSTDDRNVLEITASHLAVAIRNAELLREKDSQVEQVRTLSEVGRLISTEMNINEILELTIREMADVMKAEICMLFLKEGEEDRIILKTTFGMALIPDASYRIGEGVTGRVAETGEPRLIRKAAQSGGKYGSAIRAALMEKHHQPKNIESLMVVPIIAKDQIIGVMKVINKANDHLEFSPSDLELFRTFGRYVGVAIENANIYKVTNDRLAIAEQSAALSLMVSVAAHEIRNTSGCIPANVAEIREELGIPDKNIEEMLTLIEDVANEAVDFAREIEGFSATAWGQKKELDVNEVIQSAIRALKDDLPRYNKSKSRLKVSLHGEPLVCELFKIPFEQIVRNIVINAFQSLEKRKGGIVHISTQQEPGEPRLYARITFEDNGPGIKPEHLSRIFDGGFTTRQGGSGVGLYLVRKHLDLLGGTIDVESEPGKGARFIVRIPLAALDEGRAVA